MNHCYHRLSSKSTASDRFSGHGYGGNDRFSETKPSDDATLSTNSRITVIVDLFYADLSKVGVSKHIKIKMQKSETHHPICFSTD